MRFVLPIIPDTFEKVQGFPQSVCVIVFPYYHVVATASHNEDDSCDIWAEHTEERRKERRENRTSPLSQHILLRVTLPLLTNQPKIPEKSYL